MSEILKRWQLRTHPFYPRVDSQGNAYMDDNGVAASREFWQQPLNPQIDRRFIHFYFDLYDWDRSELIQHISTQTAFQRFTALRAMREPRSVLIVIQGSEGTGCESMRNLILHKIKEDSNGLKPVVTEVELDSNNQTENMKEIARTFYDAYDNSGYPAPTRAVLKEIYDEEKNDPNPGAASVHASLFRRLNRRIRAARTDHRMVLLLKGTLNTLGDTYDTWEIVYNSTSTLFQYIIVLTTREDHAHTIHKIFRRDNKNVTLIKARELELNAAKDYLQARLAYQRTGPVTDQLLPFTDQALTELFEPGSTAVSRRGKPISVPFNIDMLNRTFLCALDYRLCQLKGRDPNHLTPQDLQIGPDTILEVRRRINNGEECPAPDDI